MQGELLISSQVTRSQASNLSDAISRLQEILDEAAESIKPIESDPKKVKALAKRKVKVWIACSELISLIIDPPWRVDCWCFRVSFDSMLRQPVIFMPLNVQQYSRLMHKLWKWRRSIQLFTSDLQTMHAHNWHNCCIPSTSHHSMVAFAQH